MIKKIFFIISIFILYSNCSFDTKSGIWTNSEKIEKITEVKETILFKKKNYDIKEFNKDLLIEIPLDVSKNNKKYQTNNFGVLFVREDLSKKSKYKYSKIKYFDNFNPELIFDKDSLIFFDKKGSIIKFDDKSKIIWKKNFYTKREKKLLPILKFTSNNNQLIVTDSFAKYYAMDLNTGEKLWEKNHKVVFISDIKIDKDRFYIIDAKNVINCFSLLDGSKIWEFGSDDNFIKSQKKLSIVFDEKKVYFNNSRGDIYSLDKEEGSLIWLTPTRDESDSYQSFLLKTSKLVLDKNDLFFSNNKNVFFSLDASTGIVKWTQKVNSDLKPVIIDNTIFTISTDGYLFVINKLTGQIVRITDIFQKMRSKNKQKNISMSGFVVGTKKVYLALNNGKILEIDIKTGKVSSILRVSRGKISEPFINGGKMFIVKNDEIIKLN